jgi:hypothetical protein
MAQEHALSEFSKYRIRQDQLYQSDFDRVLLGEEVTDAETYEELREAGEDE